MSAIRHEARVAVGGPASNDGAKRAPSNTFNVFYPGKSPSAAVVVPSNGNSVGPGKAVVTNPYNVPLFKDAGSLGVR